MLEEAQFEVLVAKPDFKFNCAHFIAYKGFRERLHGHNYTVSVRMTGFGQISSDGYLLDFGDIKKATRKICQDLNEHFICPMLSDAIIITEEENQLCLKCEDSSFFSFPKADCYQLPIIHSSAEELAHYMFIQILRQVVASRE
jgi:6-pyruvoyltetrahydropterin/6-carboxytetrahydropterin synthase